MILRDVAKCLAPLAVLLLAVPAVAEDDPCTALPGDKKAIAERLMDRIHPHDCCDDTLARCLAAEKPSRLVRRLASEVCRQVRAGRTEIDIERSFAQRAASMLSATSPVQFDLADAPVAGDAAAPVEVVAFVCARCPFCAKLVPALHTCVTEGALAGKARLALRLFPIRSHEGAVEGGLALEAARLLGRFWPFALEMYRRFEAFDADELPAWAAAAGIAEADFARVTKDPKTRDALVEQKKLGVKLGVEATPTMYVNGRLYRGDMDLEALRDVLLEEHERVTGVVCQP